MVFAASVRRSVGFAEVVGVPGSKLQNPRISPPSRQRKTKCHMPLIPREKLESVISEISKRFVIVRCLVKALRVDKQVVDDIKFDQSFFGENRIVTFSAEGRLGNYTIPTTSAISAESVKRVFFVCAMR